MIYELMEEDYTKVKLLFADKPFIEGLRSTLERKPVSYKQVLVDNKEDPQTAVIVVFQHNSSRIWIYFGGREDNEEFNKEFRKMLYEEPVLEVKEENFIEFCCELSNSGWEEGIKTILKDPNLPIRYFYEIKELKLTNWRSLIPEGYSVEPIDLTLMEKDYLKSDMMYQYLFYATLLIHWYPLEEGLKDIRGFLLFREDKEIVSFCILGFLTEDNEIEVNGIHTLGEYQRRGFASIVGAATVEYCLSKYKTIRWICNSTNIGSCKTAEKIGYERIGEYKQAIAYTNQVNNWIANGFLQSINNFLVSNPNNTLQLNRKAHLLARFGRKEESLKVIHDLVEREPQNGFFYETYGEILLIFQKYEKAIVKFQKALELEPNGWSETYIKMAECYKELGNFEKSIEYANKGRELAIVRKEKEWIERADKLICEVGKLKI